jgi:hypothetical protein
VRARKQCVAGALEANCKYFMAVMKLLHLACRECPSVAVMAAAALTVVVDLDSLALVYGAAFAVGVVTFRWWVALLGVALSVVIIIGGAVAVVVGAGCAFCAERDEAGLPPASCFSSWRWVAGSPCSPSPAP